MKKTLAILTAAIMAGAMSVSALAMNEEDVQGTWYLETLIDGEDEYSSAEIGMEMVLEINEDGSFSLGMEGDSDEGTWEIDGEKVVMTIEDDAVSAGLVDGNLVIEQGETVMNFSREKVEVDKIVLGSIIENPELSDFDGTWTAAAVEAFGTYIGASVADIEMTITIADGKAAIHFNSGNDPIDTEDVPVEVKDGKLVISDVEKVENMTGFYLGYTQFEFGLDENGIMFIGDPSKLTVEETEVESGEETEFPDINIMIYFVKEE